jgi:hypothetical protein
LQAPYWNATYGAINLRNFSYITVDGGATGIIGGINGNASYVNGYIENTANGTSGSTACPSGSCSNQTPSAGIVTNGGGSHFIIKNLAIYDIYVRTGTTDESSGSGASYAIFMNDDSGPTTNVLVSNCLIHDAMAGYFQQYNVGSGPVELSFNTIYNTNWGGEIGDRANGCTMSGLLIHDNWVYNWTNWNDTTGNAYHHNGFFPVAGNGSSSLISGLIIYNNKFGPGFGGSYQTAAIYCNIYIDGVNIFNNLFVNGSGEYSGNGMIACNSGTTTATNIYNNTFIHNGVAIDVEPHAGGTVNIKNNLGDALSTSAVLIEDLAGVSGITWNSDYNLYYGYGSPQTPFAYYTGGSNLGSMTLAQWQTSTGAGNDAHDVTTSPNLSATYTLNSGSPAIGAGANLTSLGITALDLDLAGVARPSTEAWDIGAYEYSSGSSDTTPPAAPSGLSVN